MTSFFTDVIHPASETGGRPSIFADDLNVFQEFDRNMTNEEYSEVMAKCRVRIYKWGKMNRVAFDADSSSAAR